MPPPKSSKKFVARSTEGEPSEQRTAILSAALNLLRRDGANGLRVRSVAAAAGCSTTGVYTWFGGKHGLVEALYVEGFERFGDALRAVRRAPTAEAMVRRLVIAYRRWAVANPTHYEVMFGNLVPGFVPSEGAGAFALTTFDILVDAVRAAIESGELAPADPVEVAFHVWAGIHGYVELELAHRGVMIKRSADAIYERGVELLLRGVRRT
jgi:AcrR family transcriptional regulator